MSLYYVSNVLGTINPIKSIIQYIRANAAPTVVILLDVCQSVPHMKVDVQSLGVDFVVASSHKMCGPTGIGFLWGKKGVLNSMAPYQGRGGDD
jgi:cysteine desulfurase/selenocysteine lyase